MLHQSLSSDQRAPVARTRVTNCLRHYTIFLGPDFSLLNLSGFIQGLKIANDFMQNECFRWTIVSEHGNAVESSCGLTMPVGSDLPVPQGLDYIVVNMGLDQQLSPKAKAWLHSAARHGSSFGALDGAVVALAKSGCLTCEVPWSVHWHAFEAMREQFPEMTFSRRSFHHDTRVFSGAGATAGIDLALCEIQEVLGDDIARKSADELNYSAQHRLQTMSGDMHPILSQIDNEKLRIAVAEMERTIEEAPPTEYFAQVAQISVRQLERLFKEHLELSPKRFFLNLRLEHARDLLLSTNLNVLDVAICSGFGSKTNFSKKFRERFGISAMKLRSS
ncbi:Carnitine catabolism transcriptional activator [Cognatishimia activa]|nr:Carnitine catabolism transcriptional activator [Cognatishimia activa]